MNKIEENAKILKLSHIRKYYDQYLQRAMIQQTPHEAFLDELLTNEVEERNQRAVQNRIRRARFPQQMLIDDFQIDHYDKELQGHIRALMSLEFIHQKENVILIGNPGVGKTALALCLGLEACKKCLNVLFVNVSDLLLQIRESLSQNQILNYKRKFEKYDLIILDELGFVSWDRQSSEILFNLLSSRVEKAATLITSNLTVNKWNEVFHDQLLTTALVDRLAYRSHLLDMSGESYRIKSTKVWQDEKYSQ